MIYIHLENVLFYQIRHGREKKIEKKKKTKKTKKKEKSSNYKIGWIRIKVRTKSFDI